VTAHFQWSSEFLPLPERAIEQFRRQWHLLAEPGTWWSGPERVAIADASRAAQRGELPAPSPDRSDFVGTVAAKVGAAASDVTETDVASFEQEGLNPLAFIELVGVVARTAAIDTALRGLGAPIEPLPVPAPGSPSNELGIGAKRRSAWVATVGAAGPASALSAVPAENRAQSDLHGALYLSYDEMSDLDIHKGLARFQLELVAARTSLLNDCFF